MNSDRAKLQQLGDAHRHATYAGDLAADLGLTVAPAAPRRRRWVLPLLIGSGSGLAAAMVVAVIAGVVVKRAVEQRIADAQRSTVQMAGLTPPAMSFASLPSMNTDEGSLLAPAVRIPSVSEVSFSGSLPAVSLSPSFAINFSGMPTSEPSFKENM